MDILRTPNTFTSILNKSLAKHIGVNTMDGLDFGSAQSVKRVLIVRPSHRLGNQLLITPLLIEVSEIFPNCTIDLFVKGDLSPVLFQNYTTIDTIFHLPKRAFADIPYYLKVWATLSKKEYDVIINTDGNSFSGRLATKIAKADYKFYGETDKANHERCPHFAKQPVHNLRNYLPMPDLDLLPKSVHDLDLKLSSSEIKRGKEILDNLVGEEKKTICIFTFAAEEKCYTECWWMDLYQKLTMLPDINIIEVLPNKKSSKISFAATTFFSNNIREVGALISSTDLFIGANSGIMQLASAVQTPTIGLFSATDKYKYQPYNEGSIGIDTNYYGTNAIIEIVKLRLRMPF